MPRLFLTIVCLENYGNQESAQKDFKSVNSIKRVNFSRSLNRMAFQRSSTPKPGYSDFRFNKKPFKKFESRNSRESVYKTLNEKMVTVNHLRKGNTVTLENLTMVMLLATNAKKVDIPQIIDPKNTKKYTLLAYKRIN